MLHLLKTYYMTLATFQHLSKEDLLIELGRKLSEINELHEIIIDIEGQLKTKYGYTFDEDEMPPL